MILNQKVIPRWLEVVSCGNRIRRSLLMPESEPKEFKEEREFESVCVFLFFFFFLAINPHILLVSQAASIGNVLVW